MLAACVAAGLVWLAADRGGLPDPIQVLWAPRGPDADASAPAASASGTASANGEKDTALIDVCGLGYVEAKHDGGVIDPVLLGQIPGIEESLRDLVEGLRGSPDAFAQAVGTVLEMNGTDAAAELDQLARQAATSEDARLYALAFRLCGRTPAAGSCALLSVGQWARLDPGNGEPWLFVFDEAAARNDRAQVDEALYRIGNAARFEDRAQALAGPIVERAGAAPADLMAAQVLAANAIGVSAALPLSLDRLQNACRGAALADGNRRQLCDAVAATMAERTDSMLVSMIGTRIGERVGWPTERVVAARALSVAYFDSQTAYRDPATSAAASYSCDGVRTELGRFGQLAAVGELQFARDWITASGRDFASFAQVAREQEERRVARIDDASRRAAATASGASASGTGN